jgi:hypothetical protein
MKMHVALLMGALVIAGCSAEDPSGPCSNRVGSYVISYTAKSGDCGDLGEGIVQISNNTPSTAPNCTGGAWAATEENCKTTGSTTCTTADGVRITQKGACHWVEDASSGSCEVQVIFVGGGLDCSGLYDVRYRRQ